MESKFMKRLVRGFERLRNEDGIVNPKFVSLVALTDEAKAYAKMFGRSQNKKRANRNSVLAMHRRGIRYAISSEQNLKQNSWDPPLNVAFFEILATFIYNLLPNDKIQILQYLDKKIDVNTSSFGISLWQPAVKYRKRLNYMRNKRRISPETRELVNHAKFVDKEITAMNTDYKSYMRRRDTFDKKRKLYESDDDLD